VEALQRRPRVGHGEPLAQDPPERAEADGPQADRLQPLRRQAREQRRWRVAAVGPARQEDRERLVAQAPQDVRERRRRGRVQPLDVVDRQQHRAARRELPQRAQQRHAERAVVGRAARGLLAQQRDRERPPARRGQLVGDLVERVVEQVAQRRERQPRLGAGRRRREHAVAAGGRLRDAGAPQRRLADPGLALERDDAPRRPGRGQQRPDHLELVVPADQLRRDGSHASATISRPPP
jgi:hypothetical protein